MEKRMPRQRAASPTIYSGLVKWNLTFRCFHKSVLICFLCFWQICTGNYKDKDGKTIYTTDVIVEEHEFAQNKDNGVGADSSETPKTDKDGFMEVPEGEVPFN